MIIIHIFIFKF